MENFLLADQTILESQAAEAYARQLEEAAIRDKIIKEAAYKNYEKDRTYADTEYYNEMHDIMAAQAKRDKLLESTRTVFLVECINKLMLESLSMPITKEVKTISKNLITTFVKEAGVTRLLADFRTKNLLLSEMNRIVNKYYNMVLEETEKQQKEKKDECNLVVPDSIKDEFLSEVDDLDTEEASKLIKDRVADSISEFMDSNALAKLEYQEVLQDAKDHIDDMKTQNEAVIESYSHAVQLEIAEMEMKRDKNIFNCLVEKLAEASIKDPELGKIFMEGVSLNMDKIVDTAQIYETFLEMLNTTYMKRIDENFLNDYINNLGK